MALAEKVGNGHVRDVGKRTLKLTMLVYILTIALGVAVLFIKNDTMAVAIVSGG